MEKIDELRMFAAKCVSIFEQLKRDLIGQSDVVEDAVIAMIAGGNVLLEGVPGVGKTRLVRSMGRVFNLPFSRIQFTPDLMPADVTGTNVIETEDGKTKLRFQAGPVFCNILLADEINRATPKTQSALLEAMQEHAVTVGGETRKLSEPFFVLATQNPIEQDGTYPLPEAQTDRFMFKLVMRFPTVPELAEIVDMTQASMDEQADAVIDGETLLTMRELAKEIPIMDEIKIYAMNLVAGTHPEVGDSPEITRKYVRLGASPRAAQALITCAKVRALVKGNFNVSYEDVNTLAYPILRHRVKLTFEAVTERVTTDDYIKKLLDEFGKNKTGKDAVRSFFGIGGRNKYRV